MVSVKKISKQIIHFLIQHYLLFLALLVFISYGQLLLMQPWQEDNVIFFKVAHINERAGYLGIGIFGSGVYKYIITPYFFIYNIFGYNIPAFYFLDLIFFFLATVAVYILGKTLINKRSGMLASYLFACGYVAFDGFVRVYNSISSSLSIIFLSLLFTSYWKFYKSKTNLFYVLALFFYYSAVEFTYLRAHYLILPVIIFEFLFLSTPIKLSKIGWSLFRLIPFVYIFYHGYVISADSRAASTIIVMKKILEGKLENTFSFFSTLGNLIIPDKIQHMLLVVSTNINESRSFVFAGIILLFTASSLMFVLYRRVKYGRIMIAVFISIGFGWLFISKTFYTLPTLIYSNQDTVLAAFVGGLSIFTSLGLALRFRDDTRKLILFFALLITANIAAYSAYTPVTPYPTGYRYLAQSNIGLIMILVVLISLFIKKSNYKIAVSGIIIWGLILLILGVTNMNNIVNNKSRRIESFYKQLKSYVQEFPKGSLILFDIQDDPIAHSWYDVSFSVAEMPNTTAIAWRWGIDRYDIQMFTEFSDLISAVKKNLVDPSKVYTFFLTKDKLYDTTSEFRRLATSSFETPVLQVNKLSRPVTLKSGSNETSISQEEVIIDVPQDVVSLVSVRVDLKIKANSSVIDTFPMEFEDNTSINSVHTNLASRLLAFEYKNEKEGLLREASYSASSQWQDRIVNNLRDEDPDTIWQSDRVLWAKKQAGFTINLGKVNNIGGLAWVNGSSNNAPTNYKIEVSLDGYSWKEVFSVSKVIKIDTKQIQQVQFRPIDTQFVKMTIEKTISGDSPAVAESWIIPAKFSLLNIGEVEDFLNTPFAYISSEQSFKETFEKLGGDGNVKVSWLSDKSKNWISTNKSTISIHYNGVTNAYSIEIPPSGTRLKKIKLSNFVIPGEVVVESMQIKNITLK